MLKLETCVHYQRLTDYTAEDQAARKTDSHIIDKSIMYQDIQYTVRKDNPLLYQDFP